MLTIEHLRKSFGGVAADFLARPAQGFQHGETRGPKARANKQARDLGRRAPVPS